MNRVTVANFTDELKNQDINDVFREFYRIEEVLDRTEWYVQSYVVVRLVTIIEQFFRGIVVIQLRDGRMKPPQEIVLRVDNLKNATSVSTEVVISASYNFQNINAIEKFLHDANIISNSHIQNKIEIKKLKKLFEFRHNIVHTVSLPKPNIRLRDYHAKAEELMQLVYCMIYGDNNNFYLSKGMALAQLNKHDDALKWYNKVINHIFNLYYYKGKSLANLSRYKEAIACFDEAVKLDPKHAAAFNNKGNSLAALGMHEKAIACYNDAIRLDPDDAAAYHNKGNSLAALGKHEEAIACYNDAIRLDPKHAAAFNNKGNSLAALGMHEKAIACYSDAARLGSDDAE